MKNAPTAEQFHAFEGLFAYFNRALFSGELPACVLNFSRHAKTLGFFAPKRWDKAGEVRHEISLNPATLKLRTPREVCSTLVHEMCHLWQEEHGKPSRTGYHNKEWAARMVSAGLQPSTTGAPGGEAAAGQKMSHYVVEGGAFARAFEAMPVEYLPWLCAEEPTNEKTPKAKDKVCYSCPECEIKVWGKPDLSIRCNECREDLEAAE